MKVLVNGATGLVGLSTIDAFLEAGHEVRASDRVGSDFSAVEKRGVEIVPADLDDLEALGRTVTGMDVVVHVAGVFDYALPAAVLDKINHQGTRNMCEAVLAHSPDIKRYVQVSSVGVYGKPVKVPCKEEYPKRPRNNYEKSKWKGEMAAFEYHKKHGLPVTAIRPGLIYGPRSRYGHSMFIATAAMIKASGQDYIFGLKSGPRTSHVHIDDVASAAVLVATADGAVGHSYNVAAPGTVEGDEFLTMIADPLGLEVKKIVPFISPLMAGAAAVAPYVPEMVFNFMNNRLRRQWNKIKEERGLADALDCRLDRDWIGYTTAPNVYDPTAIEELGMKWKWPDTVEGIKATIEWYRENEWIP